MIYSKQSAKIHSQRICAFYIFSVLYLLQSSWSLFWFIFPLSSLVALNEMSLTEIEFAILFILLMRHISDWNRNIKWEKCKTRLLDCKDLFIYISIDTQQDRMPQKWTQVEEEDAGEWLESTRAWWLQSYWLIYWLIDWFM